jgi:hypothetical protein
LDFGIDIIPVLPKPIAAVPTFRFVAELLDKSRLLLKYSFVM